MNGSGECCFFLQVLSFCLFPLNSMSTQGHWGPPQQHSPQQPGSLQAPLLPAHPHWENGKQQQFPHQGAWGCCHLPSPLEPKSSGFPWPLQAGWSIMRYCAGLLICVGFNVQHHLVQSMMVENKALSQFFGTSSFLSLHPSLLFSFPSFFSCIRLQKGIAEGEKEEEVETLLFAIVWKKEMFCKASIKKSKRFAGSLVEAPQASEDRCTRFCRRGEHSAFFLLSLSALCVC